MAAQYDVVIKIKVILLEMSVGEDPDREMRLEELKTLIQSATATELARALDEMRVDPVLHMVGEPFLSHFDEAYQNKVLDVFEALFEGLSPEYISSKLDFHMATGLAASNARINQIWLKTLLISVTNEVACRNLNNAASINTIFLNTADLISKDITVSGLSCKILCKAFETPLRDYLFVPEFKQKLASVKSRGDVIKLRVLGMMVQIATLSQGALESLLNAGYLEELRHEDAAGDDPLFTLNVVQLLTDLARAQHGIEFMHRNGFLKKLADQIVGGDMMFEAILLPGYYCLFGAVGTKEPSLVANEYKPVVEKLMAEAGQPTDLLRTCIEVLGSIGKSIAGKKLLRSCTKFNEVLKRMGEIITCNSDALKTEALVSLAWLLQVEEPDPNGEVEALTEDMYERLCPNRALVTGAIIGSCRTPFLEERLAALEVVRTLSTHLWGQKELITSQPKFVDYLTDRSTEFDKAGKEAKFAIIRELNISPFASTTLSTDARLKIRKYYNEGPYYVETETAVAVEGET